MGLFQGLSDVTVVDFVVRKESGGSIGGAETPDQYDNGFIDLDVNSIVGFILPPGHGKTFMWFLGDLDRDDAGVGIFHRYLPAQTVTGDTIVVLSASDMKQMIQAGRISCWFDSSSAEDFTIQLITRILHTD